MKKMFKTIISALLISSLCAGTVFAAEFDPSLNVDTSQNGKIVVSINEENNTVLAEKKPTLTIPCNYADAYVEFDGETIPSTLENEEIFFTVTSGGEYSIIAKESSSNPDDSEDDNEQNNSSGNNHRPNRRPSSSKNEDVMEKEEVQEEQIVPVVPQPETTWENPYNDLIEEDWYYSAVEYVQKKGLMNGVDEDNFGPAVITTRGMLTTILWRLEGCPDSGLAPFLDVDSEMYYADAIAWATEKGIVSGYGITFGPDDPVTREQLVTILWRYAQYKGYDVSEGEDTNILSYTDVFDISEYAFPAMQWACGEGIINGNDDGSLSPAGNAQRAHLAQILMKFLK